MTPLADYTRIKYEINQRICTITLSRPERLNALDDMMIAELMSAFQSAQRDNEVKVILLKGDGESFCSGADIEYLQRISKYDFNRNQEDSNTLMRLFLHIYTQRKPVIAVVQGGAFAGGCGLATVCDIIVASKETARFGYTEVKLGFIPAIVVFFLVRRVGEGRARELALRGNSISAEEALNIGLINYVVPETEIEKVLPNACFGNCEELQLIFTRPHQGAFSRIHGMSVNDALSYASNLNALTRMTDDCKKGIESFLKKEPVKW